MEEKKAGIGSIIATILIIAVIILGALYFWGKRVEETRTGNNLLNESSESDVETILSLSSDDDLDTIEAELNSTNPEPASEF
ncbi:MAG: hypothetical protein V4690_03080 [Patescibacteria group bacterium]